MICSNSGSRFAYRHRNREKSSCAGERVEMGEGEGRGGRLGIIGEEREGGGRREGER